MSHMANKEKKSLSNDLISQQRGVLMGLSILLIIFFHFTEDCKVYGVHFEGLIRWFRTYIGSSSVDTFLFLSGLGLYYSMKKNPDMKDFYKKRIVKILVPYAIVALPVWIWMDFFYERNGFTDFFKDFTFVSMYSGTILFWYILMILVCYLIFPYIFRIVEHARDEIEGEMYFISLLSLVIVVTVLLKLYTGSFYSHFEIVLTRFPMFLAGCFYGRSSYEKRKSYWKWGVMFTVSVLALVMLPKELPILGRYIRGIINISGCAMLAAGLSKVKLMPLKKILEWFGTRSLELYLTHVAVRKIMKLSGYKTCYGCNELIMVVTAIFLAWILHMICIRISPVFMRQKPQK